MKPHCHFTTTTFLWQVYILDLLVLWIPIQDAYSFPIQDVSLFRMTNSLFRIFPIQDVPYSGCLIPYSGCPISDRPESTLSVFYGLKVHRFSFRWAEWGVKTCSWLTCIYYTYPEFFRQFLEVHFFYRTFLLFVASPLFPYFGVQRRKPTGCYMFGLKFST